MILSLPIEILKVKYICAVIGTFETSFSHGKLSESLPANAAWQVQKGEAWVWILHYQQGFTQVTEFQLPVNHAHLGSRSHLQALSWRHQPVQINNYPSWAISWKGKTLYQHCLPRGSCEICSFLAQPKEQSNVSDFSSSQCTTHPNSTHILCWSAASWISIIRKWLRELLQDSISKSFLQISGFQYAYLCEPKCSVRYLGSTNTMWYRK